MRNVQSIGDEVSTAERRDRDAEEAQFGPEVSQELEAEPIQEPVIPPVAQSFPAVQQALLALWAAIQGAAGPAQAPAAPEPVIPEDRAEVPPVRVPPVQPQPPVQPAAIPPVAERPPLQITKLMKEAKQLGCEAYDGTGDVSVAERWLERVTRAAEDLGLSDTDKVVLATRLLEGDAQTWWSSVRTRYTVTPAWDEFARVFNEQYYTQDHRDQMVVDFYRVAQDSRTVVEYESEFRRLARFVPESERAETLMAYRFEEGLSSEVRAVLGTVETRELRAVVTAAQRAERVLTQQRAARVQRRDVMTRRFSPWSWPSQMSGSQSAGSSSSTPTSRTRPQSSRFQTSEGTSRFRPTVSSQSSASVSQWRPQASQSGSRWCRNCGGEHSTPCPYPVRCFRCGQMGHFARGCPGVTTPDVQHRPPIQPVTTLQTQSQGSVRPTWRPTAGASSSGGSVGRPSQGGRARLFTLADAALLGTPSERIGMFHSLFSTVQAMRLLISVRGSECLRVLAMGLNSEDGIRF